MKVCFGVDSFTLTMPTNLQFENVQEVRILPRNRCFYAEFVYKVQGKTVDVDPDRALGIDPGLSNWLTCISNTGTGFIVDGKHIKSMNQHYNKQVATFKERHCQGFWSGRLAHITEKRNRQMRDAINKAARLVINHCIEHHIGTVVFGWNQRNKDSVELGKKNNQEFVQVPTARLKTRVAQLCQQYGLSFVETEESYTSKASYLDNDVLPTFGEKPEGWRPSGRRIKRGLYRSAQKVLLNADANGAANILRKVTTMLGLDLSGVAKSCLTQPRRVRLFHV